MDQIPYICLALSLETRMTFSISHEPPASFATRETNSAVHGNIAVWHNGKRFPLTAGKEWYILFGTMYGASVSNTMRRELDGVISRITAAVLRFEVYVITPMDAHQQETQARKIAIAYL